MGRFAFFADMMSGLLERTSFRPSTATNQDFESLCIELVSGRGEVSGMRMAQDILSRYRGFGEAEKINFFHFMADKMDIDVNALIQAAEFYRDAPSGKTYQQLALVCEPPRQEFLRRLNQAPGATLDLVRMRLDLLRLLPQHPELSPLDIDFVHLLRSWFNRGFLVLRQIDWHVPANILEKIIAYEAVHAINDWSDLRRRLLPNDRRCFAFFHPAMLEEPLIFVEVALCKGITNSVQALLAENRAPITDEDIDTAVFYSISNCQEGLRGISFGNSLIKQVVAELRRDLPQLKSFVTLSPIPGLMKHIKSHHEDGRYYDIISTVEQSDIDRLEEIREQLTFVAADYLVNVKHRNGSPDDPVARFHLGNGAQIHRVHALADTSENGMQQSATAMVNYLYDLNSVEENHEEFATRDHVVTSKEIKTLLSAGTSRGKNK